MLARREDGFHAIRSVMVPLALSDELIVEPSDAFRFSCDRADLADQDNLVVRAARSLTVGGALPPWRLALSKRIPTRAGLGGGSSDAAGVLLAAMDGAFGEPPGGHDWLGIARQLGSDVPFFLTRSGALVEGTGERVTATGFLPSWHVAVVKPPADVSTADAYAALDRSERPARVRNASISLQMLEALQRADFERVQACLQNDFHDPMAAQHPPIARALEALRRAGATPLLAGSGSAAFALARDAATIDGILQRLDLDGDYVKFATRFAPTPAWQSETAIAR